MPRHIDDVVSIDQYNELKRALDMAIAGKHKYGELYEELLEEKAKLEEKIQYLNGMVEAFKIALCGAKMDGGSEGNR